MSYLWQISLQPTKLIFFVIASDCYDVYKANKSLPGIYTLNPGVTPDSQHQFTAYCLTDGWTVIQSRGQFGNPEDFFLKKWDDYVHGFGDHGLTDNPVYILYNISKNNIWIY